MNVNSVEKKEKSTAEVTVTATAAEFDEAVNKAYVRVRNRIAIPGFRKGKAPRKIIEGMYGPSVFYEDALDILSPNALQYAVDEEKLTIVGRPSILDFNVEDDKSVTVKYLVSLYPEVTMGQYQGIEAEKNISEVTDADVDSDLESTRKRNARIQTAERPAADGDTVNIDYEGFLEGKPFDGGKDEKYDLTLGSHSFVPGFEEQLIGASAGDEKDLDITFPEDYAPELAGKAVVFHVKVNEVKENLLPDLDDEFAKDVSEFETLEEYRKSIRERLEKQRADSAERMFKAAVMDKVLEGMTADVPDAMVDARVESTLDNYRYNMQQQGFTLEQYMQMMGTTVEEFKNNMRPASLRQIKTGLALEKIAELEKIEATEEEIDAEYKAAAERYGVEEDLARKSIGKEDIAAQVRSRKAEEFIYAEAKVVEKAAETEEKSAEE